MTTTISELLWISYVLREFKLNLSKPMSLYCDNKFAIHMSENHVYHEKTKHTNIDCHFSRHHFTTGFVKPIYVDSSK